SQDPAVEYVLNFDGVHLFDEKNIMIDESVANVARLIIRQTPAKPEPVSMIETRVKIAPKAGVLLGIMMVILVIIALIVLAVLNGVNQPTTPTPDPTHTPESAAVVTDELSLTASETVTTQPTNTATIELSPTPQTDISSILPEQLARTPVERNEDWTPYEREIDGVMMVLVPNGCFILGTDNGGYEGRESPTSKMCFDEPFWIDKYEVTKSQFESFNGQKSADYTYNDDNLPIEMITWFEARQFCESRNGRLPTEVQWEYAARGPNNWIYPWGNNFNPNNLVYVGTANIGVRRLYPAGSYEGGMSWVGAMDMAGNVWEWVNSVYMPYPYSESSENPDMTSSSQREYVIRGGGWSSDDNRARSAFRGKWIPTYANYDVGFRCVRDFEG
ncbi:MAG: formylglycine-generating enzyme family protein, partial [Anaerolineae bacterium]|nr:formylglycine-generating enzyme family protein [Anaerolineae bacterium]